MSFFGLRLDLELQLLLLFGEYALLPGPPRFHVALNFLFVLSHIVLSSHGLGAREGCSFAQDGLLESSGFRGEILQGDDLSFEALPPLPRPVANLSGAVLEDTIYLLGGQEAPDSTEALRTFWALDLGSEEPAWRELEPWPGPARILAAAASGQSIRPSASCRFRRS